MMEFRDFVQRYPGGRKAIASELKVTEEAVRTWETGDRTPRPKKMLALIQLSKGRLRLNSFPGAIAA